MTEQPQVFAAALSYKDPRAALDWLEEAFGFEMSLCISAANGQIMHAEMVYGDARVMLGAAGWADWAKSPADLGGANTQSLHVSVKDVDAHFARAKAAGAIIHAEPEDQFYGDRIYRAEDPEGHHWTFGQAKQEVAPEDWGLGDDVLVEIRS